MPRISKYKSNILKKLDILSYKKMSAQTSETKTKKITPTEKIVLIMEAIADELKIEQDELVKIITNNDILYNNLPKNYMTSLGITKETKKKTTKTDDEPKEERIFLSEEQKGQLTDIYRLNDETGRYVLIGKSPKLKDIPEHVLAMKTVKTAKKGTKRISKKKESDEEVVIGDDEVEVDKKKVVVGDEEVEVSDEEVKPKKKRASKKKKEVSTEEETNEDSDSKQDEPNKDESNKDEPNKDEPNKDESKKKKKRRADVVVEEEKKVVEEEEKVFDEEEASENEIDFE